LSRWSPACRSSTPEQAISPSTVWKIRTGRGGRAGAYRRARGRQPEGRDEAGRDIHVVSAPVTLEPPRGRFFSDDAARLGGMELLRSMMEHRIPDPLLTRLTDLRVTEVGLGAATMAMPATPWWQSAATGVFLAGAIA
jgi:hypothetical protein